MAGPNTFSTAPDVSAWKFAVRALRYRNYRLFFGGQSVSLIGTWMTRIATGVAGVSADALGLLLGVAGFSLQIPFLILGAIRRRLGRSP